jgi:aminodeoxychorismate lyase
MNLLACINGQFVPAAQACVSVFDRSFLYGDGLFETLYAHAQRPFRLDAHLDRLEHGARHLGLRLPFDRPALAGLVTDLLTRNAVSTPSLLRLTLSRGVGPRGYSPRGADTPTLVITQHPIAARQPAALRWRLATASVRLPTGDVIARFKTCNKLPQILARAEAEARGADEALLLNTGGWVAEAASSNLFWVRGDTVFTAPLASGILAGVTRAVVFELCAALDIPVRECSLRPAALWRQDAVFLSLSSVGIVAASHLDGRRLGASPLVARLRRAYWCLVESESGVPSQPE